MKSLPLTDSPDIPAGLYGRLGNESSVRDYETALRKRETNTVSRDDDAGTLVAHSKKGTLILKAIRKGPIGQPWLIMFNPIFYPKPQVFRQGVVTVRKHPETKEQFAVFEGTNSAVPFDICKLAAGRDKWMREIVFSCVDCAKPVKAGESECQLCPVCLEKVEKENAELNG
jgi:hypothetical protein